MFARRHFASIPAHRLLPFPTPILSRVSHAQFLLVRSTIPTPLAQTLFTAPQGTNLHVHNSHHPR
jgi:hypothetical protein